MMGMYERWLAGMQRLLVRQIARKFDEEIFRDSDGAAADQLIRESGGEPPPPINEGVR